MCNLLLQSWMDSIHSLIGSGSYPFKFNQGKSVFLKKDCAMQPAKKISREKGILTVHLF